LLLMLAAGASGAGAQTWERKCVRGLAGMTLGFLEVPGNMVAEAEARGPGEGLPFGFVKGLGMLVVREPVGVYEFLTTPFPVPEGFRPIFRPEFTWDYFVDTAAPEPESEGRAMGASHDRSSHRLDPHSAPD
jgi:putative exosortase-associated protein (TIGR04073 family)